MIKNVILDFGHGGINSHGRYTTAPGKMWKFPNGEIAYEGVLNRQIGKFVQECLEAHKDLNVVTTVAYDDPTDVSLAERVRITNSYKASETIFISIHCNAGKGTGFEIFTTVGKTKSDKLAEDIATAVEHVLNPNGIKKRYDMSDGDKDKESDFYVLRKTKCPAVLVECGFFDNYEDYKFLKNESFQANLGSFIYTGIITYINGNN